MAAAKLRKEHLSAEKQTAQLSVIVSVDIGAYISSGIGDSCCEKCCTNMSFFFKQIGVLDVGSTKVVSIVLGAFKPITKILQVGSIHLQDCGCLFGSILPPVLVPFQVNALNRAEIFLANPTFLLQKQTDHRRSTLIQQEMYSSGQPKQLKCSRQLIIRTSWSHGICPN